MWRRQPDSNRRSGFCKPVPYRLAMAPLSAFRAARVYHVAGAISPRSRPRARGIGTEDTLPDTICFDEGDKRTMSTGNRAEDARAALFEAIDQRTDELTEIVAELVRRPSELGHEALVQEYVAEHLRGSDAGIDVWDLDDSIKNLPNAGNSGVPFAGRPNVTGKIVGAGGGKSMIFNG